MESKRGKAKSRPRSRRRPKFNSVEECLASLDPRKEKTLRSVLEFILAQFPELAFEEISRIQIRQRLNPVVTTGVPGFIPQVKSTAQGK